MIGNLMQREDMAGGYDDGRLRQMAQAPGMDGLLATSELWNRKRMREAAMASRPTPPTIMDELMLPGIDEAPAAPPPVPGFATGGMVSPAGRGLVTRAGSRLAMDGLWKVHPLVNPPVPPAGDPNIPLPDVPFDPEFAIKPRSEWAQPTGHPQPEPQPGYDGMRGSDYPTDTWVRGRRVLPTQDPPHPGYADIPAGRVEPEHVISTRGQTPLTPQSPIARWLERDVRDVTDATDGIDPRPSGSLEPRGRYIRIWRNGQWQDVWRPSPWPDFLYRVGERYQARKRDRAYLHEEPAREARIRDMPPPGGWLGVRASSASTPAPAATPPSRSGRGVNAPTVVNDETRAAAAREWDKYHTPSLVPPGYTQTQADEALERHLRGDDIYQGDTTTTTGTSGGGTPPAGGQQQGGLRTALAPREEGLSRRDLWRFGAGVLQGIGKRGPSSLSIFANALGDGAQNVVDGRDTQRVLDYQLAAQELQANAQRYGNAAWLEAAAKMQAQQQKQDYEAQQTLKENFHNAVMQISEPARPGERHTTEALEVSAIALLQSRDPGAAQMIAFALASLRDRGYPQAADRLQQAIDQYQQGAGQ